jgi:hypothetical protein
LWDEVGAMTSGGGKAYAAGEWLTEATDTMGCEMNIEAICRNIWGIE